MNVFKLKEVKYSDHKRELSYEFNHGKLYSIYDDSSNGRALRLLFQIFTYTKLPSRGEVFWRDVKVNKLNPTSYRNNMVTIVFKKNTLLKNIRVINYLKYVTNNLENLYIGNVEFIDYLQLVNDLLQEFGFDKKKMRTKIKKLDSIDRCHLKLVESLLKGSNVVLIYITLDFIHDAKQLDFYINSLYLIVEKYNLCVITFTEREDISNKMNYLINIGDDN